MGAGAGRGGEGVLEEWGAGDEGDVAGRVEAEGKAGFEEGRGEVFAPVEEVGGRGWAGLDAAWCAVGWWAVQLGCVLGAAGTPGDELVGCAGDFGVAEVGDG